MIVRWLRRLLPSRDGWIGMVSGATASFGLMLAAGWRPPVNARGEAVSAHEGNGLVFPMTNTVGSCFVASADGNGGTGFTADSDMCARQHGVFAGSEWTLSYGR